MQKKKIIFIKYFLGKIEELQEVNRRSEKVNALNYLDNLDKQSALSIAERYKLQEEEDERELRRLIGKTEDGKFERRIEDDNDEEEQPGPSTLQTFKVPVLPQIINKPEPVAKLSAASIVKPKSIPKFMQGVVVKRKKPND